MRSIVHGIGDAVGGDPAVSAQQTSAAPSSAAAAASTSAAAPASAEPSAAATSAAKAAEEQGSNGSSLSSDSGLQPNTNATPGANFTGQKSQIEENPSWILSENKFADKAWAGDLDRYSKYTDSQGRKRVVAMAATSPSMNNAKIPLGIIRAKDANRPTMYLLNGAGGGEQSTNWMTFDSAIRFYLDRNVNVVVPMRGAFTYYIDWYDKKGAKGEAYIDGPQNWETFLTKELAEPIEQTLGSNGQRGIVGLSMSATSSLLLAARTPGSTRLWARIRVAHPRRVRSRTCLLRSRCSVRVFPRGRCLGPWVAPITRSMMRW